jgi:predicted nucleic acid-binding protein
VKVFVDTNVLLDVLARREPFYRTSAELWTLAERGDIEAYISAITFNNIYYIVRKLDGPRRAVAALRILRDVFLAVAPDIQIINQSIDSGMSDFEDAVQFFSAIRISAECLVTRNPSHFKSGKGTLPILSPEEFLTVRQRTKST